MKILALLSFRNDSAYVLGCIKHLEPYVDGIIALNDCSIDGADMLVGKERAVATLLHSDRAYRSHLNQVENRERLLKKALQFGADWVLCVDADERFETEFLKSIRSICESCEKSNFDFPVRALHRITLWNQPYLYRTDPPWRTTKSVLFPCVPFDTYWPKATLRQPWYPPVLAAQITEPLVLDYKIFHLRYLISETRQLAKIKWTAAHPEGNYDHLVSEKDATFAEVGRHTFKATSQDQTWLELWRKSQAWSKSKYFQ